MLTAQACVRTDRPDRYLAQLRGHTAHMAHGRHAPIEVRAAEWSDDHGVVTLDLGRWSVHASPGALTLRVEATTEEDLRRLRGLLGARLEKIGRRDHLTVTWRPDDGTGTAQPRHRGLRRGRWLLVAAVAVAVGLHLGLGVTAFAASGWTVAGLVGLVALKLVALRLLATHRRGRRGQSAPSTGP